MPALSAPTQVRPGVRRGVFVGLGVGMLGLGALVAVLFPFFAVLLGVPSRYVLTGRFWLACLLAGLLLGGANWVLARATIGSRLRVLTDRLGSAGRAMRTDTRGSDRAVGLPRSHRLPVRSDDDLGRTTAAFNGLLEAVDQEHRFRSLVQPSADLTCLVGEDATITFICGLSTQSLGWAAEDLVGRSVVDLTHPDDVVAVQSLLAHPGDPDTAATVRMLNSSGGWAHLDVRASDHRDAPGIGAIVLSARDVTERHEMQGRMAHLAAHDSLTGLPNRASLMRAARTADPGGERGTAVLVMDLDRFKEINDTLGHTYGDRLLFEVAERLRCRVEGADVLVRLGGDEFAVLLLNSDAEHAHWAALRLLAALDRPFHVDGLDLAVRASIGVALHRGSAPDIDVMLREADIAMYSAKDRQTGVEVYDPGSDHHDRNRLVLLSQLHRALSDDQMLLHYQPKVSLDDGHLVGVEALVRWRHPEHGLVLPGVFLPSVEHTGLITPLTDLVLDRALAQVAAWRRQGYDVPVAVNLSARCLHHDDLASRVEAVLTAHDVPPRLLRLELTESAFMADPDTAMCVLERLHSVGVRFSIDDFGTGYSSMSYLHRLPVDELKIDRSFVNRMTVCADDAALVRSVVNLGHTLGLTVVAEGVENPETAKALADVACDAAQGYQYDPPLPAADLTRWLDGSWPPRRLHVARGA